MGWWLLLVVLSHAPLGSCIKCHICNSMEDKRCLDPFNVTSSLQDCSGRAGGVLDVVEIIMQNLQLSLQEVRQDRTSAVTQSAAAAGAMSVCQKITVLVREELITSRGCSPVRIDGMHPCDAVKLSAPESSLQLRQCRVCATDACNAAAKTAKTHLCAMHYLLVHAIVALLALSLYTRSQ